jgi:hypothetical protein
LKKDKQKNGKTNRTKAGRGKSGETLFTFVIEPQPIFPYREAQHTLRWGFI